MSDSLAARERRALCDLALDLGPDAPTLCEGWVARDLLAHLLVRERQPLAAAGNVVPALAGRTRRATDARRNLPFEELVADYRTPARLLRALPRVDAMMNGFEHLVHHEDLRRAVPGWEPRDLPVADLDALWSTMRRSGALLARKLPVPTVVRRSDTGETWVARKGSDPVTISGPVVELVLFLYGRSEVRDVELDGPPAAVAAVRDADLGT